MWCVMCRFIFVVLRLMMRFWLLVIMVVVEEVFLRVMV